MPPAQLSCLRYIYVTIYTGFVRKQLARRAYVSLLNSNLISCTRTVAYKYMSSCTRILGTMHYVLLLWMGETENAYWVGILK